MTTKIDEIKEEARFYYQNDQMYFPEEFDEDFKFFNLFKRQLKKHYESENDSNFHLALNHIITLTNVFKIRGVVRVLRKLTPKAYHHGLNSFLLFLNMIPEEEENVNIDAKIYSWLQENIP